MYLMKWNFKIINDAGGNMNGNTSSDRTVYFQTIPSNYLETSIVVRVR